MSDTCSMAFRVIFANLFPSSALGSICALRAEMTANSLPTKKALITKRTTSQTRPIRSFAIGHLRRVLDAVYAPAIHADNSKLPGWKFNQIALLGDLSKLCHNKAGHGVVVLVISYLEPDLPQL